MTHTHTHSPSTHGTLGLTEGDVACRTGVWGRLGRPRWPPMGVRGEGLPPELADIRFRCLIGRGGAKSRGEEEPVRIDCSGSSPIVLVCLRTVCVCELSEVKLCT